MKRNFLVTIFGNGLPKQFLCTDVSVAAVRERMLAKGYLPGNIYIIEV